MAGVTGDGGERPTTVLLVDDDAVVRFGLATMLRGAADVVVVAEAGDGAEALQLATRHRPDVVLMDIRMPVMDGLAATEQLRRRPDPPEVLVLTTFDADGHVLRALRAGASGFLLKDTPPEEIVGAIRQVAAGRPVLSPDVMRALIARVTDPARDARSTQARDRLARLAPSEHVIAVEVGNGSSNADIAASRHLSLATVKSHVSAILTKLDLDNRVQIAILVHEADLGR